MLSSSAHHRMPMALLRQTFLARRQFPHTLMEQAAAARFAAATRDVSYSDAIQQAHHECELAYSFGSGSGSGTVYVCVTSNDVVVEVEQSRSALLAQLIYSAITSLQICADCG